MNTSKIGVLFLVSALALGGIGTSFAMWSETITIDGSVSPGSLNFDWSVEAVYDSESTEKGAASSITAVADGNTMTVTIDGAYPCITYSLEFDIHCVGNVPVHFDRFILDAQAQEWVDAGVLTIGPDPQYPEQDPLADDPATPEFDGTQLHQGDEWYGLLEFHFSNQQSIDLPIEQGTTYTFTIQLFGYQYNEPCDPTIPEKILTLPDGIITATFHRNNLQGYWRTVLTDLPGGGPWSPPIAEGVDLIGWCVDEDTFIVPGQPYDVTLMSSYDPGNPWPGKFSFSWPCVNYILNNKIGTDWNQVQLAIWYFINNHGMPAAGTDAYAMVQDALANGKNYIPQNSGEWVAVLVIPDPEFQHGYDTQKTFIEVDP